MSGVTCVGFPHSYDGRSQNGDMSHTGEVVLCQALVEQARHEHMSDEYKTGILLKCHCNLHIWSLPDKYESTTVVPTELTKRGKSNGQTGLPNTYNISKLRKLS